MEDCLLSSGDIFDGIVVKNEVRLELVHTAEILSQAEARCGQISGPAVELLET